MTPAHTIREALNGALEAQAIGHAEAMLLFNPDREVNSLAERLVNLTDYGVPRDQLRAIFTDLRAVIDLNCAQNGHTGSVAAQLDELAATLHREVTEAVVDRALGIKSLVRVLRPALGVMQAPQTHTAAEYVRAVRDVDRVITSTTRSRLLSTSVRHELGAGKHDLLTDLMSVGPTEAAA